MRAVWRDRRRRLSSSTGDGDGDGGNAMEEGRVLVFGGFCFEEGWIRWRRCEMDV